MKSYLIKQLILTLIIDSSIYMMNFNSLDIFNLYFAVFLAASFIWIYNISKIILNKNHLKKIRK